MDGELSALRDALYAEGREHDAPLADRLLRRRNMTPAAAALVATLIRVQGGTAVLEIGASNGYAALWFAEAVRDTGGRLTTVDVDAARVAEARRNLERGGLAGYAEVRHGDGGAVLEQTPAGSLDLVVLDAERPAYPGYLPALRRALRPHGVIAVDNAVSHRDQVLPFEQLLRATGEFAVEVHEVGDGVVTAVR